MVEIKYIGFKPAKRDTVAGTGTIWDGHGDVRAVPDEAARVLVRHPDVWAAVGASDIPEAPKAYGLVETPHPEAGIHDALVLERKAAEQIAPLADVANEADETEAGKAEQPEQPDQSEIIERIAGVMRGLSGDDIGERGKPLMSAVRAQLDGVQFTRAQYDAALAAAGY